MGMRIRADTKALRAFAQRLGELNQRQRDAFFDRAADELGARMLGLAVDGTPVRSGELRRGWTCSKVKRTIRGVHTVTVVNPVRYASYVEYGHRKRGGKGWVEGQFFLRRAEGALEEAAPSILQAQLDGFIRRVIP